MQNSIFEIVFFSNESLQGLIEGYSNKTFEFQKFIRNSLLTSLWIWSKLDLIKTFKSL
jgi:hypothetical protein